MNIIVGGAYQGKLDYAKEKYNVNDDEIFTCNIDEMKIDFSKKVINNFHLFIYNQVKNNIDSLNFIKENINLFSDKIIISDDISCGVVPVDSTMRELREALGRSLAYLSKNANTVERIFCGIPTKIK